METERTMGGYTMREIDVARVEETVYGLFLSACCEIGDDVLALLTQRLET